MTNEQKYKTQEARFAMFNDFCNERLSCQVCPCYKDNRPNCAFIWLAMEADEQKPDPCPFCGGGKAKLINVLSKHFVQCEQCFAQGPSSDSPFDAIAAWNRCTNTNTNTNTNEKENKQSVTQP